MKKEKKLLERVGKSIREKRKEKGLTQEDLAEKADVNPKFLGKVERAETNISLLTLAKICDALGISLCELLAFTSMGRDLLRSGELSSEIWKLIKEKDEKTIQLSMKIFKELLEGIEALSGR
jgi:transcriptional regulator with XRE-family HTH domain